MTLRGSGPALLIGLLALGVCVISVRAINQLQGNLTSILNQNVTSLQAAQDLEIKLRQLRFHSLTHLVDPSPERLSRIREDQAGFEQALERARTASNTDRERRLVAVIEQGYFRYRSNLEQEPRPVVRTPNDLLHWADNHPVRELVTPCHELLEVNQQEMQATAQESEAVSRQARTLSLVLAVLGPLGGVVGGFGIARGLSQSIAWLNVWVRDVHARLDQKAGAIRLSTEGNLQHLDGQVQQVVDRVQDMVQRLQQQQQQILRAEQLAAVGQLAAAMAHEIRNPLTTIKLLIGVALRRQQPDALSLHDLEVIHQEIARLEQTVQGLLDYARPPALRRESADLVPLVERALELVRPRAAQQGVSLVFHRPAAPFPLTIDGGQIHTVLLNLLLNALDAMPQGGTLTIDLEHLARNASLRVSDTGTGIPPAVAGRLFTPFVTSRVTGTGLGLSTCRRIVEGHGGTIEAANRPQGGACFRVLLPISDNGDRS